MLRLEQISGSIKRQTESHPLYAIPVSDARPGQTPIYRHPSSKQKLLYPPIQIQNLGDFWDSLVKKYRNNKLIQQLTYGEVNELTMRVGSWFLNNKHERVYFYAKNCAEWTLTDLAAWNYGFITIPLYDTLGREAMDHIVKLTEGTLIATTQNLLEGLIENIKRQRGKLRTVLVFDMYEWRGEINKPHHYTKFYQQLKGMGLEVITFSQILQLIPSMSQITNRPKLNLNSHLTYTFTSGTTGLPKGAIGVHLNAITVTMSMKDHYDYHQNDVHISHLPIAHMYQRFMIWCCIYYGTNIRYCRYPANQVLKNLADIRPTALPIVPRLLNKIYPIAKQIYDKEFNANPNEAKTKIKALFGGRLTKMLSGSAPVAPQILKFFREVLQCDVRQGYGQTQTTASVFVTYKDTKDFGHVGGVNTTVQFKLVDVPEMNYMTKVTPKNPCPKGQVCMRGHSMFLGYFKDEQNTRITLDDQGWNHSGDVGMILPGGAMKIIDRKKNIYKLSQGEYVAPEKVENVYLRCKYVAECFLYGDSLRDYSVAIVHPSYTQIRNIIALLGVERLQPFKSYSEVAHPHGMVEGGFENQVENRSKWMESYLRNNGEGMKEPYKQIIKFAEQKGISPVTQLEAIVESLKQKVCKDSKFVSFIHKQMNNQAEKDGLYGFQTARKIMLSSKSFGTYGIFTTTLKLQRVVAKKVFLDQINMLYSK